MIAIIYLLSSANILLVLAPLWWTKSLLRLPLINPLTVVAISSIPMNFLIFTSPLILSTYISPLSYAFTLFINVLVGSYGLFSLIIGSHVKQIRRLPSLLGASFILRIKHLKIIALTSFVVFLLLLGFISIRTGGLVSWLLEPRTAYITRRDGYGVFYALSQSFLFISVFSFLIPFMFKY